MKNEHSNDPLSTALQGLETRPASAGFTDGVLARLDERDARRRRRRTVRIALAVQAALVVLVAGAVLILRPATRAPEAGSQASAEEIRRQYRELQEELELLQRASDQRRTVLYLDSSDDYDLVLDLNPLLTQRVGRPVVPALQDLRVRPARTIETDGRNP